MSKAPERAILPEPPDDLKQLSRRLSDLLSARIDADGPMPFREWMEAALYEPGLGYYSAGLHKIGEGGDFTTAPEQGRLFGRSLARTIAAAADSLGDYHVLEIGAGTGALAEAVLSALPSDLAPAQYDILERSGDLREVQRQRLARFGERVRWIETPPEQPWRGVMLANEVVDALAVERFRWNGNAIGQLTVERAPDGFQWATRPAPAALAEVVDRIRGSLGFEWPDGYVSEVQTALAPWLATLTSHLERGLLLIADYGYPRREYYLPERSDGTLVCHYRHRAHGDPFWWPGLQDISAFVDFTAVADAADENGLVVHGYQSQAWYLLNSGLLEDTTAADAAEIRQLALPGNMGERFQVMALTRDLEVELPGFGANDLRRRL